MESLAGAVGRTYIKQSCLMGHVLVVSQIEGITVELVAQSDQLIK